MATKVLLSMRDMAASAHLLEVIKACKNDSRFEMVVVAQNPASDFLSKMNVEHEKVELEPAIYMDTKEATALLDKASEILERYNPQVILSGLSTPLDGGIDEAILAQANGKIPTFMFQDFWGEQNQFFGKGADVAFVLDDVAAERNNQRFGLKSIVSGSPRHAAYRNFDWAAARVSLRDKFDISEEECVIGFFGQALNHIPGYWRTVLTFIQTVGEIDGNVSVAVRHHPRESEEDRDRTMQHFENVGVRMIPVDDGPLEDTLPLYDVVCSLFSNCTFDASYQNWFSSEPLSVPVSMLFDPEIAEYYRQRVHFENLPIHIHKLVVPVYEQQDLLGVLENAVLPEARRHAWLQAKEKLEDPGRACEVILNELASAATGAQS